MIYDLKELNGHLGNTEWRNDSEKFEAIALMLFGVAERLEALVEAQKPRWVELRGRHDNPILVNPKYVIEVVDFSDEWLQIHKEHNGCVHVSTANPDASESSTIVKGTVAEVIAKLRGSK